jgi:hypothetical protein
MKAEIRMAIREEGDTLVARIVLPDETLEQALTIATIRKTVADLPGVFNQFTELCASAVRSLIENVGDMRVDRVEIREAPEHEKAGHA